MNFFKAERKATWQIHIVQEEAFAKCLFSKNVILNKLHQYTITNYFNYMIFALRLLHH